MTRSTDYVHFDGIAGAELKADKTDNYCTVDIVVREKNNGSYKIHLFCEDEAEMAIIMAAMAKAVRDYYGNAEPEPDWEAIAAEMAEDRHREVEAGI